jgi:transcriptional regulator with XRE-family HTH domain
MVASYSPAVIKRWIAFELKRLREDAGRTRPEAAARIGKAITQIGHLETMRNLPSPSDLEILVTWYGHPERVEFFLDLLRRAKKGRDWWIGFADVTPEWFSLYLGLESSAVRIEAYDVSAIRGIFQTPAYAEAVIRGSDPVAADAEVQRRTELRLARQERLREADEPVRVWSVLDEATLRRTVGGPAVMREQLEHLLELGKQPNIDIQLLPYDAGAHPGVEGSFTILSFPDELGADNGIAYVESRIRGIYYEERSEILNYRDVLSRLQVQALDQRRSQAKIMEMLKEL